MTTARELTNRLAALLRNERNAMAEFLLALSDFDGKRLWRELGHTSLFSYLRRELGLSAGAAQYRKTAVELIQKLPQVEAALRDGRLCLSTVIEVAKVLTPENVGDVLPRFFGLSRREAEAVAVSIRPVESPPRRDVVTQVRSATPVLALAPPQHSPDLVRPAEAVSRVDGTGGEDAPFTVAPEPPPRPPAPPCDSDDPLDGELSRVHWTVPRKLLEKLEAARDALSHSHPGASNAEIIEAGLDLILSAHAKKKGLVEKPLAKPRPSKQGRYIPAHVRREVWKRDQGRCQFRFESGEVCGSTFRLEVDHLDPVALGGVATVERCRLACEPHNKLAARRVFGDELMDVFARKGAERDRVREPVAQYGCSGANADPAGEVLGHEAEAARPASASSACRRRATTRQGHRIGSALGQPSCPRRHRGPGCGSPTAPRARAGRASGRRVPAPRCAPSRARA